MAYSKDYQQVGSKPASRIIQALNSSVQELLYSHIDPLFKQWLRTFHNAAIIIAALLSRFLNHNRVHIPESVLSITLSAEQRETLGSGKETELIEGFISRKGNHFSAYLQIDETGELKFRFPEKESLALPEEFLGVKLTPEQYNSLKSGEETSLVEGLKGKRGIPFNAFLKMDKDGGISFRFQERGKPQRHPAAPQMPAPRPEMPARVAQAPGPERPSAATPVAGAVALPTPETPVPGLESPGMQEPGRPDLSDLEIYGLKISEPDKQQLLTSGRTELIGGFRTSSGKTFVARLELHNHQLSLHIPQRSLDTGITIVPKTLFKVEISEQNRRLLLGGRSTGLIEGMITPAGVKFDGWLKFDPAHRLCVNSAEQHRDLPVRNLTGKSNEQGLAP